MVRRNHLLHDALPIVGATGACAALVAAMIWMGTDDGLKSPPPTIAVAHPVAAGAQEGAGVTTPIATHPYGGDAFVAEAASTPRSHDPAQCAVCRGTRKTIPAALIWLASHQEADGRWEPDGFWVHDDVNLGPACDGFGCAERVVGVSAAALLALIGGGQTHREGRHQAAVRKGLEWLVGRMDASGWAPEASSPYQVEDQALLALALCEAYRMTHSGIWKQAARRAAECAHSLVGHPHDAETAAWLELALASARISKLLPTEVAPDFATKRPRSHADAAIACLRSDAPQKLAPVLAPFLGTNGLVDDQVRSAPSPRWFLGTLVAFDLGGPTWRRWSDVEARGVLESNPADRRDGNFDGSWDPPGDDPSQGGRVFATAMATLTAQIYYRYRRAAGPLPDTHRRAIGWIPEERDH